MKDTNQPSSRKRFRVCGVTCHPHLPECNNYCNMKTICGQKYIGAMPDSPAEMEPSSSPKEGVTAEEILDRYVTWTFELDECADKIFFLKAMEEYASKKLEEHRQGWVSVKERLPEENVSVFVFIPEEDYHITTGMWDISKKWVLLDEYRVPRSDVTYWRAMVDLPEDKSYTKSPDHDPEEDTITYKMRALQKKVFDLESLLAKKKQ